MRRGGAGSGTRGRCRRKCCGRITDPPTCTAVGACTAVGDDVAMPVRLLDEQHASELRAAPLSYTPREAQSVAAGYSHLNRSVTLTRRDFDGAARGVLFAWRIHSRLGYRCRPLMSSATPHRGADAMGAGGLFQ